MTVEIHGFCEDRFAPLKEAFGANFEAGDEIGASLALTHHGKFVVDLWAGHADRKRTRPWEEDTIVLVFSTTKIMAALCALMVVDRGLLELDAPVCRYWPEFAAGGKGAVTVRDALTHRAGVPGFQPAIGFDVLCDWEVAAANLAAQPHWFDGERIYCYHANTFGFLLGELVRRADGRTLGRFFAEEVAVRTGADFHIGLTSRADFVRLAGLQFPLEPMTFPPGSTYEKVFGSVLPGNWMSWETLSAEIPASNGCGNGRSIARTCAILAMGGSLDGERYLSRALVQEAASEQVFANDDYFGWIKLGLGFGLASPGFPLPSPTCMHWGGYGGSWGLADPGLEVSLGYAPNNMLWDNDGGLGARLACFREALEKVFPTL